jgi:hypothetical protein
MKEQKKTINWRFFLRVAFIALWVGIIYFMWSSK